MPRKGERNLVEYKGSPWQWGHLHFKILYLFELGILPEFIKPNEGVEKECGETPSVKILIKEFIKEPRVTSTIFLDHLSLLSLL